MQILTDREITYVCGGNENNKSRSIWERICGCWMATEAFGVLTTMFGYDMIIDDKNISLGICIMSIGITLTAVGCVAGIYPYTLQKN